MIDETTAIMGFIGLLQTASFFYIKSISTDQKCLKKDLEEFKNGHYRAHMDEAKSVGRAEAKLDALHRRVDDLHN